MHDIKLEEVLDTKYYISSKCYRKKIADNAWVCFAPDCKGMPIVISELSNTLFDAFEQGVTIREVMEAYRKKPQFSHLSEKEFLAPIFYFVDFGFLKKSIDSIKYKAKKFSPIKNIKSIAVWLHITNQCNLKCDYCFVSQTKQEMSKQTMQKVATSIINTAKKHKLREVAIKFAGGEPSLVLNKIKFFTKTLKNGLKDTDTRVKLSVLSNGTCVTDDFLEFLQKEKCGIGISLDGHGEDGHDIYRKFKVTNLGSWKVIERNIQRLIENGIRPYIMSTISEKSCSKLTELVQWIFDKDLRTRLSVIKDFDTECSNSNRAGMSHEKYINRYVDAFEALFVELEKEKYTFNPNNDVQLCELHFDAPLFSASCGIATSHIVINQDGKLTFCPMSVKSAQAELGDDLLVSIRNTVNFDTKDRNNNPNDNCLTCQWFPVCVGGCSYSNMQIYNSPFGMPVLHDFYFYVVPRYIEFYGKKLLQQAKKNDIDEFQILSG